MTPLNLKETATAGLIAAVYAVLALVFYPISFAVYQVRVAEALTVLPFLMRAAVPGLFVGCLLANLFGGMGWQDIVFGALITLVAAMLTRLTSRLPRGAAFDLIAVVPILLLWVGGLVLLNRDLFRWSVLAAAVVAAALAVLAAYVGVPSRRLQFIGGVAGVASLLALAVAVFLSVPGGELRTVLIAAVALVAAWALTLYLVVKWRSGDNVNVLIAPLPPVLLNAFGVSLYLSPIMGVSYWFAVQMVGVGQLIACYLLGLPLLKMLERQRRSWV